MKPIILSILFLLSFIGYTQVQVTEGKIVDGETVVHSNSFDESLILGYVANKSRIQEFANHELVDTLKVTKVSFYTDKIFYEVVNSSGHVFGLTFTFSDRTVFMCDSEGSFIQFSGAGITFAHQY